MQGVHLSRVQEFAIELVLIAEERRRTQDWLDRFKLAVVSSDPGRWIAKLFPVVAGEQTSKVEADPYDLNHSEGEWVFTEDMTPDKAQELLRELQAQRRGVLTLDDVEDDEDGWQ